MFSLYRSSRVAIQIAWLIECWRSSPVARSVEAQAEGFEIHWGRKVLEIRPPVPVDKGQAVSTMVRSTDVRSALYGGDDVTDLDAFDALDALIESGDLDVGVRVGVRSAEGPRAIVERADVVVEGVPGFEDVLAALLP